jgi:hypothetical protein
MGHSVSDGETGALSTYLSSVYEIGLCPVEKLKDLRCNARANTAKGSLVAGTIASTRLGQVV